MTFREVRKLLETAGWHLDRIKGSHHIFKKKGQVIPVPQPKGKALPIGTLRAIRRQFTAAEQRIQELER